VISLSIEGALEYNSKKKGIQMEQREKVGGLKEWSKKDVPSSLNEIQDCALKRTRRKWAGRSNREGRGGS